MVIAQSHGVNFRIERHLMDETKSPFDPIDATNSGFLELLNVNSDSELYFSLAKAAEEKQRTDETRQAAALQCFSGLYGMMLHPENPNVPYRPLVEFNGNRSALPEDFTEGQLDVFEGIAYQIERPSARARILDVLWLRRRIPAFARDAIESYLSGVEAVSSSVHGGPELQLRRAL